MEMPDLGLMTLAAREMEMPRHDLGGIGVLT